MAEQDAPIRTKAATQMRPIEFVPAAHEKMRNVGAVESFAFHDVSLHPNHLLRRAKFNRQSQELVIVRPREPRIVHFAQSVARTKNQINIDPPLPGFGQPMWRGHFSVEPGVGERTESCVNMYGRTHRSKSFVRRETFAHIFMT